MMRQRSQSSSLSANSTSPAPAPKKRLNFFSSKKSSISISREGHASFDKVYEPPSSDRIPTSPLLGFSELEPARSPNGLHSPDSFGSETHNSEYVNLRSLMRQIRKAPAGTDPRKVDAVWEVYKKVRDEGLLLCKSLLQKPEQDDRSTFLDSSHITPIDTPSSPSACINDTSKPFHGSQPWLTAVNEYKVLQASILENLRHSLLATYKAYEPNATSAQLDAFLQDKVLRKNLISKWREESVHRMKSEKLSFWEQYRIRSLNYDRLTNDIGEIENHLGANDDETPNVAMREYVVAKNGDTILEFANSGLEVPSSPILRFRVSSHLLAEASPLFAQFLSPQKQEPSPDILDQLPPPPSRYTCKDGIEVKLYRMPQLELNKDESLTILLYAAHMQHAKVPREIEFPVFVSIADVCLRYQCTSPLELQVEYQWLPQWIHLIQDDHVDGFLLISYTFGLRRIFTRMSKSAILNAIDEDDIQNKNLWPQAVRDRIKAVRAAKIAQVNECCTRAIKQYFRPPIEASDHLMSIGTLQLTSVPRCLKGSHLCDATNLGWLMLVCNELQILPAIFEEEVKRPRRSLKELLDCLRHMTSAPQVHSGMCDYAVAFRSDINDISNSVSGLTFGDVNGINGWALSKHAGPIEESSPDIIELEASPLESMEGSAIAMSNEDISLRILSHLDDLDDLNSAAMIDKTFYQAYKRNEATLLKNVMRAEKRRTVLQMDQSVRLALRPQSNLHDRPSNEAMLLISKGLSNGTNTMLDDLYDVSRPNSYVRTENITIEEAQKILWPDELDNTIINSQVLHAAPNEKSLTGEILLVENKTRIMVDEKHLRDEKDQALGLRGFI